jgi:DNA-binding NtrC family response regulator
MTSVSHTTEVVTLPPAMSIVALDDDADFREYIHRLLDTDGHTVRTVATPDECFAEIAAKIPDVVLLDIKMGRDSGEAVLEQLRTRWPRLCVIVVTGYPSLDSMRQTFKRDVFDYLAKPFSIEDLRRTLAQAAESLGLSHRPQDRLRSQLGRHIRVARTERGWTLKELSEASDVSVSQLSSIERGSHLPSLESLLDIASALDARPSQWLTSAGF